MKKNNKSKRKYIGWNICLLRGASLHKIGLATSLSTHYKEMSHPTSLCTWRAYYNVSCFWLAIWSAPSILVKNNYSDNRQIEEQMPVHLVCIKNTCQDYTCTTCQQVYILTDVRDSVHPAPNSHFVPYIGGVTELMDNCDVVWVGTTEQLSFQGQWVNLESRSHI